MHLPSDLKEFARLLCTENVEALVVGAHAVAFHSRPRFTGDLDFFIGTSQENVAKMRRVLTQFGFAPNLISDEDLAGGVDVIQLGRNPIRLDLLTSISGVTFDEAWPAREPGLLDGIPASYISKQHLIQNKQATGRPQDLADIALLQSL